MLNHPTFEQLRRLKLTGMLKALQEQEQMPDIDQLGFLERLGLLVDREVQERDNRPRLRFAKLKQAARLEDLNLKTPRQLDRSLIQQLADGRWVAQHLNVLITGPTGVGKSFWPVPWPRRPAARVNPPSTSACPGCSPNWRSPAAMAAIPN